jgi:hypothetical protein
LSITATGTGSITVTLSDGTTYTTVSGTTIVAAKTAIVGSGLATTYTILGVTDQYGSGTATGAATISTTVPVSITMQPVPTVTVNEGGRFYDSSGQKMCTLCGPGKVAKVSDRK